MKKETPKALSFPTRAYGTMTVYTPTYRTGDRLAVELVQEDGETFTMLSVNLPKSAHLLGPNEFFAKTWSENEEVAEDALASGIFRYTGRTSDDDVNAPIWTFK